MSLDASLGTVAPTNSLALHHAERVLAWVEVLLRHEAAPDREIQQELAIERVALEDELRRLTTGPAAAELPELRLAARYDLRELDRKVAWLAVAPWLEPGLRRWIARVNENLLHDYVDAGLCLRLLCPDRPARLAALSVLDADAPLFAQGLLRRALRDVAPNNPACHELVPAEHLVGYLRDSGALSPQIATFARRVAPELTLASVPLPDVVRERLFPVLAGFFANKDTARSRAVDRARGVGVLLVGPPGSGRTTAVKAVTGELGRHVTIADGQRIAQLPMAPAVARLVGLMQEAELRGDVLLVRGADGWVDRGKELAPHLAEALTRHRVPVVLLVEEDPHIDPSLLGRVLDRQHILAASDPAALREVWHINIGDHAEDEHVDLAYLAKRLNVTGGQVRTAAHLADLMAGGRGRTADTALLESAAVAQLGSDMGHLARISEGKRSFDDLILEQETADQIREIISAIKARHRIMRDWGLRAKLKRGIGICCLFDGDPGTGKTLAAEVIAGEVGLRLFHVNVPGVVDKYIGETEKNLARIFERARPDTTILLFDEADSLFSKRTEVSRSTDRYANMEINVLLQLIERYEGVSVLTTNLKQSIDNAFERRITFKVNFPMPEDKQRRRIWRHLLPPEMPLHKDVDTTYLGEMELSGGEIKNAILRAAYAAAHQSSEIDTEMLFEAARREAAAAGRLVREVKPE